jgi:hypothetical protein
VNVCHEKLLTAELVFVARNQQRLRDIEDTFTADVLATDQLKSLAALIMVNSEGFCISGLRKQ